MLCGIRSGLLRSHDVFVLTPSQRQKTTKTEQITFLPAEGINRMFARSRALSRRAHKACDPCRGSQGAHLSFFIFFLFSLLTVSEGPSQWTNHSNVFARQSVVANILIARSDTTPPQQAVSHLMLQPTILSASAKSRNPAIGKEKAPNWAFKPAHPISKHPGPSADGFSVIVTTCLSHTPATISSLNKILKGPKHAE